MYILVYIKFSIKSVFDLLSFVWGKYSKFKDDIHFEGWWWTWSVVSSWNYHNLNTQSIKILNPKSSVCLIPKIWVESFWEGKHIHSAEHILFRSHRCLHYLIINFLLSNTVPDDKLRTSWRLEYFTLFLKYPWLSVQQWRHIFVLL